jgi:hypothetical protein
MLVYQIETDDYGWVTVPTIPGLMSMIEEELEANNLFPGEITMKIKMVEMSQEELDNLPTIDD